MRGKTSEKEREDGRMRKIKKVREIGSFHDRTANVEIEKWVVVASVIRVTVACVPR